MLRYMYRDVQGTGRAPVPRVRDLREFGISGSSGSSGVRNAEIPNSRRSRKLMDGLVSGDARNVGCCLRSAAVQCMVSAFSHVCQGQHWDSFRRNPPRSHVNVVSRHEFRLRWSSFLFFADRGRHCSGSRRKRASRCVPFPALTPQPIFFRTGEDARWPASARPRWTYEYDYICRSTGRRRSSS